MGSDPGGIEGRGHGDRLALEAFSPSPYVATYAATKAFVNSFTEALHEELRGTGVKVQALCPGFTRTEFQKRANLSGSDIPSFAWQSADQVAAASLSGLKNGSLVVVPGLGNRAASALSTVVPRGWLRRLTGLAMKRSVDQRERD